MSADAAERPEPPDAPLFDEQSWIRRVSGEPVLIFGGGRALLLEIAHPLVAAGVADHSNFREEPFGRLRRTLAALSAIVFGTRSQALRTAAQVERAHARVQGVLRYGTGRFPAGTPYHGRDPDLTLWVWATLVDSARVLYERFVEELPAPAREAFYADHCRVGELLGVPPERMPPDWPAFQAWFEEQIAGDLLEVTPEAREIGRAVFAPTDGSPAGRLARHLTAALLPERLRGPFGLRHEPHHAERLDALVESVRKLRRS